MLIIVYVLQYKSSRKSSSGNENDEVRSGNCVKYVRKLFYLPLINTSEPHSWDSITLARVGANQLCIPKAIAGIQWNKYTSIWKKKTATKVVYCGKGIIKVTLYISFLKQCFLHCLSLNSVSTNLCHTWQMCVSCAVFHCFMCSC